MTFVFTTLLCVVAACAEPIVKMTVVTTINVATAVRANESLDLRFMRFFLCSISISRVESKSCATVTRTPNVPQIHLNLRQCDEHHVAITRVILNRSDSHTSKRKKASGRHLSKPRHCVARRSRRTEPLPTRGVCKPQSGSVFSRVEAFSLFWYSECIGQGAMRKPIGLRDFTVRATDRSPDDAICCVRRHLRLCLA